MEKSGFFKNFRKNFNMYSVRDNCITELKWMLILDISRGYNTQRSYTTLVKCLFVEGIMLTNYSIDTFRFYFQKVSKVFKTFKIHWKFKLRCQFSNFSRNYHLRLFSISLLMYSFSNFSFWTFQISYCRTSNQLCSSSQCLTQIRNKMTNDNFY